MTISCCLFLGYVIGVLNITLNWVCISYTFVFASFMCEVGCHNVVVYSFTAGFHVFVEVTCTLCSE